jgi:hypothetical protein
MCKIKGKMYNVILNLYNNVKSRSSSKLPWITKVLSRVENFFLRIVWFSFKRRNSSEKIFNLLYNTDVNNFPKQLKMITGKRFTNLCEIIYHS